MASKEKLTSSRSSSTSSADGKLAATKRGSRPSLYHVDCHHCHHDQPQKDIARRAKRKLLLSCIICALFIAGEVTGGILSHSLAIASDAAHMLSDLAGYIVGWLSLWLAEKPPTQKLNFGFYRAEILGALLSILIIWCVSGILVYVAIERFITGTFDLDAEVMLIVGCLGLLANIILGLVLHLDCGKRSNRLNGHSHTSISIKAAAIHVLGDLVQSLGVVIAAVLIYINPEYKFADPICTIIFSIIILFTTLKVMRDILYVLMEGTPEGIDLAKVRETIMSIPGVTEVYNLRIWALSMEKAAIAVHIAISKGHNPLAILKKATEKVGRLNFFEMTLQIEEFNEESAECPECSEDEKEEMDEEEEEED